MSRFLWIYTFILLAVVLVGSVYSHHGFLDLRRLHSQIERVRERTTVLEKQNQELKRLVSLSEKPTADLIERQMREVLGWVKPDELVYLETNSNPTRKD